MVSVKLGLGFYIRLWLGLGLRLPNTSIITINRNPEKQLS